MKKAVLTIIAAAILAALAAETNAQMMMSRLSNSAVDWNEVIEHTLREEKEGKELWDKFRAKEVNCADLTDEQFGVLGEYFMGEMLGDSHAAMNAMMIQMLGEEGEEQMHIIMGKRLSACDPNAAYPAESRGFMPMMQMMWGGWSPLFRINKMSNTMMNNFGSNPMGWFGLGLGWLGLGWLFMIFWWLLIISGIVFLIRWLVRQIKGESSLWGKSALDILKERYAKGEITKQEFEEKKREIA